MLLSAALGTRHRAAIGITEEADCFSVVVSEETGRISVAAHGEITSGVSPRELYERICRHFGVRITPLALEEAAGDVPMETHATQGKGRS